MSFSDYSRGLIEARRGSADRAALVILASVTSTQELARRIQKSLVSEGSDPKAVDLVAWEQTEGRGRAGRSWQSPGGAGVWVTLIRTLASDRVPDLPIRVPTVLASAVSEGLDRECRIKWPNDLLVGGRKIAGVLVDVSAGTDGRSVVAVGLGVNVTPVPVPGSTSIAEEGGDTDLVRRATEWIEAVGHSIEVGCDELDRYRELLAHRPGDVLRCRVPGSPWGVEGTFLGVDAGGRLRLSVDGVEHLLPSAELAS